MTARDEFPKVIKDILANRVANRCSNPDCQAITSGPQTDPARATNIGVAAHVTAASVGGPRYDPTVSPEQRASAQNGIWLCQNCAALIDRDIQRFSVDLLHAWKTIAEDRARNSIGKTAQSIPETETQRKMKKLLSMKDQTVTLRWLRAPQHADIAGRVKGETEMIVQDCNEDYVQLLGAGSGSNLSLPLEKIMISRDDQRHRPALECHS